MASPEELQALARAMASGGAQGAAFGGATGAINGLPGALAGMQSGAIGGALPPVIDHFLPGNQGAQLLGRAALMPFPLNIPAGVGGALMLMGAKPTPNDQLVTSEPSGSR